MNFFVKSIVFCLLILVSCEEEDDEAFLIFSNTYDFNENLFGWEGDFTDYPAVSNSDTDTSYRWSFEYSEARPLGNRKAVRLSCNNRNGDVFMFMKKKVSGFQPNTNYNLVFEVELATNAQPGENLILKVGAVNVEPKKIIEGNSYGLNIDKGSTYSAGEDIVLLGDVATQPDVADYTLITKSNSSFYDPFIVRSNSQGDLWLLVGTHSGYQGETTVFYTKVNVVFSVSK